MHTHAFGRGAVALAACTLTLGIGIRAQQPPAPTSTTPAEVGIPITSQAVRNACGSCHRPDDKGQMSRISFQRNTPEGWQDTIKRMVALNGLKLDPAVGREVVKYLSDNLGLAPEEARSAAYEVERRVVVDESAAATEDVSGRLQCVSLARSGDLAAADANRVGAADCHASRLVSAGRPAGLPAHGTRTSRSRADGRQPDTRHPSEKAVDHLSQAFPLQTPEWASWSATKRSPRIDGTWALSGYEVGKGPVYGRVVIAPVPNAPDEFTTETTFTYARPASR